MISNLLRRVLGRCLLAMLVGLGVAAQCATADVLVVLSDETASYQQVADELRAGLKTARDAGGKVDVITAARLGRPEELSLKGYELVVTVGLSAARAVVTRDGTQSAPPPTLCLLIPRQAFEALVPTRTDGRSRRLTAVYIDQPLSRQLDLMRIALPGRHRVGVILGPSSKGLANELRDGARERDLSLRVDEIAESPQVYGALQRVLPQSDVLLALADPMAFNASTVYGLMLTTYRAQVPVVGFSEGLVKAGALLGLYSTARQVGKHGAEIAVRMLAGDAGLPAPQYPRYFTVRVNNAVARSLGIQVEDEGSVAAALATRGDGRREVPRSNAPVDTTTPGRAP